MIIVAINAYNHGSTGKVMQGIANEMRDVGNIYYVACPNAQSMRPYADENTIYIGTRLTRNLHVFLAKLTGLHGFFSLFDTWIFLKKLKRIKPDVIHLHNLHGDYINIPLLFRFIKKNNVKVIWTMHDCWHFTGHCPHFLMAKCDKWKTGCNRCRLYRDYPSSLFDMSKIMWKWKKKCFNDVENLLIVTPSKWLSDMVKQSFLKEYSVKVINNGINIKKFKPTESNFRNEYGLNDEYIILGVSFLWSDKKGLDIFLKMANLLDERFKIVLVGTNEQIDEMLPKTIISIHRTENLCELAKIYTEADVFLNPTREDTFPTVNLEALACGTPVVTFNIGGSGECITEKCGYSVPANDIDALIKRVIEVCEKHPFTKNDCIERAANYELKQKYQEYLNLYEV